jgi:hypothetical protein
MADRAKNPTKAERIFEDTYEECRKYILRWGYQTNPDGSATGFNRLYYRDDEIVYARTINEITKILENKKRYLRTDIKLGVLSEEKARLHAQVLCMVESTINNEREKLL